VATHGWTVPGGDGRQSAVDTRAVPHPAGLDEADQTARTRDAGAGGVADVAAARAHARVPAAAGRLSVAAIRRAAGVDREPRVVAGTRPRHSVRVPTDARAARASAVEARDEDPSDGVGRRGVTRSRPFS